MADALDIAARRIIAAKRAQLVACVLGAIKDAGKEGYPVAALKKTYDMLGVEQPLRDAIERQLTVHGLIKAAGDKLFHVGTRADYMRLADKRRDTLVVSA